MLKRTKILETVSNFRNAAKLKEIKDKVETSKKVEGMDVSDLKKQLDELEKERKKLQGQAEDMKKKEKVSIFPS